MEHNHHCTYCNQKLDIQIQSYPAKYNRPDRLLVTCTNPDCHKNISWQTKASVQEHVELVNTIKSQEK